MVLYATGAFSGQIPVGMVGQVNVRRLVGRRVIVDADLVVVGQGIGDLDVQIAGIPLFHIRTDSAQLDADFALPADLFGGPNLLIEPLFPTVQRVGPVVERQVKLLVVNVEGPASDAVGVTARDIAEIGVALQVLVQGRE